MPATIPPAVAAAAEKIANDPQVLALLKDQSFADMGPSLLALGIFVCAVSALAMARYRTTLD